MNLIYITLDGGEQYAYQENEVYDMVAQQAIPPHAHFWKEGMTEWRPIGELPPRKVSSFVPPRRTAGSDSGLKMPSQSLPVESAPSQEAPTVIEPQPLLGVVPVQELEPMAALIPKVEAEPEQVIVSPGPEPERTIVAVAESTPTSAPSPEPHAIESVSKERTVDDLSKPKESKRFYFRTNPRPLTICLQVLMVLSIGTTLLFIYDCLDKIYGWSSANSLAAGGDLLSSTSPLTTQPTGVSNDDGLFLLQWIGGLFCVHVLVEVLFFIWIFYANKNSRVLATNIKFTPGWAVADFFIPVINLFRPYQIVQEIWKVSENPQSWNGRRDSIFVGLWFIIRLSVLFLPLLLLSNTYSDSADASVRMLGTVIYLATIETNILLVEVTTLILVSVVISRQIKWVRKGQ